MSAECFSGVVLCFTPTVCHRLGQCNVELQEALDEAEYWRDVAALEGAYVSTQLELEEAAAEAERDVAALEGADVSTRLDGGDPEGYAEYCRMAADAGFI